MISLDGFFEREDRSIDWHVVDDDFNRYAIDFCRTVDTFLFGRITYELMAEFWPSEEGLKEEPDIAEQMNTTEKVVFSRTLDSVEWQNSRLVKTDAAQEVAKLKELPGSDIAIFGSSDLSVSLLKANLIDEFRIMIAPIFLGSGKTLFQGLDRDLTLTHEGTQVFDSGLVMQTYKA